MNINLIELEIKSFKGVKSFTFKPEGKNVVLLGENGTGKTSVYDAFLWLLFGKDSTGRKQFDIRPLDGKNQLIEGLTVSVTGVLHIDGKRLVLRKNQIEKTAKKVVTGYTVECWVDEVPKKVSEYDAYIAGIVSEDTFKLLTDLHCFSDKLHWSDRRKVLLDIAGNIPTPKGFEELLAALNGRSMEDYKAVLAEQRKRLSKEKSEINPRMDEIQRGLDAYAAGGDTAAAEKERGDVTTALAKIDKERQKLIASDQLRATLTDTRNKLKTQRSERETRLSMLGLDSVLKEKTAIDADLGKREQTLRDARSALFTKTQDIADLAKKIERAKQTLAEIRERFASTKASPMSANCYACGQALPPDKQAEVNKKKDASLAEISKEGAAAKHNSLALQTQWMAMNDEKKTLIEAVDKAAILLKEAEDNKKERFGLLDQQVALNKIDPATDAEWVQMGKKIAELEKEIGAPAGEQLSELDAARNSISEKLQKINTVLANADNAKKAAIRLNELSAQEKDLAIKIAEIDKRLAEIDAHKAEQSKLIEAAVNGLFKHVNFKLFKTLMNGSIEDTCEATLNGVPYAECSYGQKILMGVDIINVLSTHYQSTVPLFLDNSEGLTFKLETLAQTIKLVATPNYKEIKVVFDD